MTVDQARTAWESMLIDANGTTPADPRPSGRRDLAVFALRTTVLLTLAMLAILVLLPAVLTAQIAPPV
jgi:hypothetical protein